jgi:hypothetical protein
MIYKIFILAILFFFTVTVTASEIARGIAHNTELVRIVTAQDASLSDQWISYAWSATRLDWLVRLPGIYATDGVTFGVASDSDVVIDWEGFDSLKSANGGASIPISYAISLSGSQVPGDADWVSAESLNSEDDTLLDSPELESGLYFKRWCKIEVNESHSACEYIDSATVGFLTYSNCSSICPVSMMADVAQWIPMDQPLFITDFSANDKALLEEVEVWWWNGMAWECQGIGNPSARARAFLSLPQRYQCPPSVCNIAGNVKDANTQQNLPDVLVEALQGAEVKGNDNTYVNGNYSIPNLAPGTYDARAKKPGYETKTYKDVQVTAGQTTTQNFNLNPSPKDTLVYDDFSAPQAALMENSAAGIGWVTEGPCSWQVQNGTFGTSTSGNRVFCLATTGDLTWEDYIYEADVYGVAGVDKAIEFRVQDYYNHYYVNLRSDWPFNGNDSLCFCKIVNGSCVDYASIFYPSQNNTWYHLKVEAIGNHFKVYVDDNFVFEYVDPQNTFPQGKIGLGCWTGDANICSIRFDNILVADLFPRMKFDNVISSTDGQPIEFNGHLEYYNGNPYPVPAGYSIGAEDPVSRICTSIPVSTEGVFQYSSNPTASGGAYSFLFTLPTDYGVISTGFVAGVNDTRTGFDLQTKIPIQVGPASDSLATWTSCIAFKNIYPPMQVGQVPDSSARWGSDMAFEKAQSPGEILGFRFKRPTAAVLNEMATGLFRNMYAQASYVAKKMWNSPTDRSVMGMTTTTCLFSTVLPTFAPVCARYAFSLARSAFVYDLQYLIESLNLPQEKKDLWMRSASSAGAIGGLLTLDPNGYPIEAPIILGHMWEYQIKYADVLQEKIWYPHLPKFVGSSTDSLATFAIRVTDELDRKHVYSLIPKLDRTVTIRGYSPIDLVVTDNLGRHLTKSLSEIPNSSYDEFDLDLDGKAEDVLIIAEADPGTLSIQVVPDSTASANDSFTVIVDYTYYQTPITIAENMKIAEIPPEPFTSEIFENLPPDTFSLTSPQHETKISMPFSLDWNNAIDPNPGHSVSYRVYLGKDSTFRDSIVIDRLTESNCIVDSSTIGDNYGYNYWKVVASDDWGAERWSNQIFRVYIKVKNQGDVNADANINLADVIYLANYVLKGGSSPIPPLSGDVTCDGNINLVDVIKLARYVLLGEPFPC